MWFKDIYFKGNKYYNDSNFRNVPLKRFIWRKYYDGSNFRNVLLKRFIQRTILRWQQLQNCPIIRCCIKAAILLFWYLTTYSKHFYIAFISIRKGSLTGFDLASCGCLHHWITEAPQWQIPHSTIYMFGNRKLQYNTMQNIDLHLLMNFNFEQLKQLFSFPDL